MPFILLFLIALIGLTHGWMPVGFKSVLYAISLSMKSVIVFCLPLIIFGLLFKTAVQLSGKASKTIFAILAAACLSNFLSTMIAGGIGFLTFQLDLTLASPPEANELQAAWAFSLPKWIRNDLAMLAGLGLGVVLSRLRPALAGRISALAEKAINAVLGAFLYVIPFFIAGFVVKMYHDQVMGLILQNYGLILGLIACAVFSYIFAIYWAVSRAQGTSFFQSLKNMMPAAIAGFGTMSSVAAMPLTLLGAEKNSQNPDLARSIVPATVNMHLIGDCFAIPIFAFAVLKSFGAPEPALMSYLVFALYFVLAKFSIAAVPGGGILVMIPILESYLGFDAPMLSLITALYILFDPIFTCANILGNGAFAMALSRGLGRTAPVNL